MIDKGVRLMIVDCKGDQYYNPEKEKQ